MKPSIFLIVAAGFLWLECGCSPDPMMGDFDLSLAGGYRLERESPDSVDIYHETAGQEIGVPAKVIEVACNERFILAKQQELQPRGDFPGDVLLAPVPGKFHFWVIDVGATNRYGPMKETEFTAKLKSLGQTNLHLKDVQRFRKAARKRDTRQ
jgi:hypothetical protein